MSESQYGPRETHRGATRAEKVEWGYEMYGPEGIYADGERSRTAGEKWAVQMYDRQLERTERGGAWSAGI